MVGQGVDNLIDPDSNLFFRWRVLLAPLPVLVIKSSLSVVYHGEEIRILCQY